MEITHNRLLELGFDYELVNDCHDYTFNRNSVHINLFKVDSVNIFTITTHSRSALDDQMGIVWETNDINDIKLLLGIRKLVILRNSN